MNVKNIIKEVEQINIDLTYQNQQIKDILNLFNRTKR